MSVTNGASKTFFAANESFLSALPAPWAKIAGSSGPLGAFADAQAYMIDAAQRSLLFWDTLCRRGNEVSEAAARTAPSVLSFDSELVLDGHSLPRPVNYSLLRIKPPAGVTLDPAKRPFIVFDPRAGHGPGIGGMKKASEIGAALQAGHPCYFVGFTTRPVPGQTVEDVCRAEAEFVRTVSSLHPQAPSLPALIGNCQAGWQIMMTAAIEPDLPGPILIAGSPLSYWAGRRGKAPLRYLGGLLGGTWLTALSGDLGGGIFDGISLIGNFESMNPANTFFRKAYNVFDHIDTEAERYLEFEKWWGNPVLLNAEEMQWIADNLFIGNRLSSGELLTTDGVHIDLRNIRSPIVVFCSWGDDITPPPQALGWLLDMYEHERDIVANGQTIIYSIHDNIGHLGIFVSGKIALKEHGEFASCMDMIDLMPPGLYEAVIEDVGKNTANPDLITGNYLFRLEVRTLDHIRALGHNSPEDELQFATVARVSEINNGLYRSYAQPLVQAAITPEIAEKIRQNNPQRLRYAAFSDKNPMSQLLAPLVEEAKQNRKPVDDGNPFRQMEHAAAEQIENSLKAYGLMLDIWKEAIFRSVYSSPTLQAAVGMLGSNTVPHRRLGRSVMREAAVAKLQLELRDKLSVGGPVDALLRAVNYIHRAERVVDDRAFTSLAEYQAELDDAHRLNFSQFKQALRTQALINGWNQEAALETLPDLLPDSFEERQKLLKAVRRVANVVGKLSPRTAERLATIEAIFLAKPEVKTKEAV
jgi:pimeloyl-ACP methyl ester carboxylesterase